LGSPTPATQGGADEDQPDVARAVGRDLELGAGVEGGLAHGSVLFVVEPGQPRGQPLDRGLELGVEVHKRAQLVGQPLEGDFLFPATGRQLLDAAIREVHAGEAIATYAAWLSQPRGIQLHRGHHTLASA